MNHLADGTANAARAAFGAMCRQMAEDDGARHAIGIMVMVDSPLDKAPRQTYIHVMPVDTTQADDENLVYLMLQAASDQIDVELAEYAHDLAANAKPSDFSEAAELEDDDDE